MPPTAYGTIWLFIAAAACSLMTKYANQRHFGYRCPSCGARSARDHHNDCSWKD